MEKKLKNLLKEYYLTKNHSMLSDILYGLGNTDLWVPISSMFDNQDANIAGIELENITGKEECLRKSFVRSGQRKYLPLFVSKEDTTDYYRNSFSWIVITLNQAAKFVLMVDDADGIVVNAFTTPFVITKEFLIYRSEKINNYVIPEGTKISYHRLDTNVESEKLISDVKCFADSNSIYGINKVYVAMIEQSGEFSYLIVVDAGTNEYENLFQRLNSYILRHGRLQYPIDYCPCTGSMIYDLEKNTVNRVWNRRDT